MTHPHHLTLVHDFWQVARLADVEIPRDALTVETLPVPHKPPSYGVLSGYLHSWYDWGQGGIGP